MSVSILDFGDAPEETMTIDRSLTGDELLINLKFNIEVKLRADNTFMIKDKAHNNCFAINGREVNGGLLFSYTFSTISAYHGTDDSLNLEIAANSRYLNKEKQNARICHTGGRYRILEKMSNDYPFTSAMKSCNEVYNFEKKHPTPESIARAKMLDDTLYYAKFDDGYYLEFENKMIIMQDENYSTKMFFLNSKAHVVLEPKASLEFTYKDIHLFTCPRFFMISKGYQTISTFDRKPLVGARRYSTSDLLDQSFTRV